MKTFFMCENERVTTIHSMPFDPIHGIGKTEVELLQEGYLVDELPTPEVRPGKTAIRYYTPEKGFWFEYVDQQSRPEEEIQQLKAQLAATQEAIDFVLMNGGI